MDALETKLTWKYVGLKDNHVLAVTLVEDGEKISLSSIALDGTLSPGELTPTCRKILALLVARRGQVVSKEMLFAHLYSHGVRDVKDATMKVFLCHLRKALDDRNANEENELIKCVWRRGYVLGTAIGEALPVKLFAFDPTTKRATHVMDMERNIITLGNLPKPGEHWNIRKKYLVILAVEGGLITREEARLYYALPDAEYDEWKRKLASFGLSGLLATRTQEYL